MEGEETRVIEFDVEGEKLRIDLADLDIDPERLEHEFKMQSSLFCHYSLQHIKALNALRRKKAQKEELHAFLDLHYRDNFNADGIKFTEAMVRSKIIQDERMLKLEAEILELESIVGIFKVVVDSFDQKGNMLVSLGALRREEMRQLLGGKGADL